MSNAEAVKALIADDHPLFRAALTQAVKQAIPDCEICEAKSFSQVSELVNNLPELELIFLDLNMPGNDGFSGLSQLRKYHPDVLIIMVSANETPNVMRKALDLGASAFVPKSAPLEDIILAIELVLNGETWIPAGSLTAAETTTEETEKALATKLDSLSPSQFKVLKMIADGMLNKQIAYELDIRETTVKQHVSAILTKLDVYNRTQAGLIFQQLKQVDG